MLLTVIACIDYLGISGLKQENTSEGIPKQLVLILQNVGNLSYGTCTLRPLDSRKEVPTQYKSYELFS